MRVVCLATTAVMLPHDFLRRLFAAPLPHRCSSRILFAGDSDIGQLIKIFELLGTPGIRLRSTRLLAPIPSRASNCCHRAAARARLLMMHVAGPGKPAIWPGVENLPYYNPHFPSMHPRDFASHPATQEIFAW